MNKQTSKDREMVRLLDLVCKRVSEFRDSKLGSRFLIEGFHFELVFAKRNAVYRARASNTWYVKIPSRGGSEKARREKSGSEVLKRVSQSVDSCYPLFDVDVCPEQGVIVSSAIPGKPLRSQLYRNILALHLRRDHSILDAYFKLGTVLAAFHGSVATNTQPTTHPTARDEFDAVVNHLPDASEDQQLRERISSWELTTTELAFIHGNLRRENILFTPDQEIGMIDFEDAGLGSRYDDISQICCALLLTKTAIYFPWRPVYRALSAMLCGYNRSHRICEKTLLKYTAIRLATKLALMFSDKRQTIAKIPLSQHKTRKLLTALLSAIDHNSLTLVDKRLKIDSRNAN